MDKALLPKHHLFMKRLASIYQRKRVLFVSAEHQTKAGFWIGDERVSRFDEPMPEDVGDAIKMALARSSNDVPTPPREARLDKPLLTAAGVGSWRTFMLMSKHVSVSSDGHALHVEPWRNAGTKNGFEPCAGQAVKVSTSIPSSELGELVVGLLSQAD